MRVSAAQPLQVQQVAPRGICGLGSGFGMNFSAGHPFRISGLDQPPVCFASPLFDQEGCV